MIDMEETRAIRETLRRLAEDALGKGMPGLSILYSNGAIRRGFEMIEENDRRLAEMRRE